MVDRVGANVLDEFEGKVVDVVLEKNTFADSESSQYHITMSGENIEVKGKTGVIHEWIRLSPKTTEESIPEGSIVDKYLTQLEIVLPEAKKAKTLADAFVLMKGKTFLFKKVKLGKAFEGHPARALWLPVQLLKR
jgi:hypothetical protein